MWAIDCDLVDRNLLLELSKLETLPMLTVCGVRRESFWNQWQLKLRESLAHLVGFIMRRAGGDASVALRVSFV
jgi:UTP:GlnB (protein PII) uridylyltransferase